MVHDGVVHRADTDGDAPLVTGNVGEVGDLDGILGQGGVVVHGDGLEDLVAHAGEPGPAGHLDPQGAVHELDPEVADDEGDNEDVGESIEEVEARCHSREDRDDEQDRDKEEPDRRSDGETGQALLHLLNHPAGCAPGTGTSSTRDATTSEL